LPKDLFTIISLGQSEMKISLTNDFCKLCPVRNSVFCREPLGGGISPTRGDPLSLGEYPPPQGDIFPLGDFNLPKGILLFFNVPLWRGILSQGFFSPGGIADVMKWKF
jgi:hypothetical protein